MTLLSVDLGTWGASAGAWQGDRWVPLTSPAAPPPARRPVRGCVAIAEGGRVVAGAAAAALARESPQRAACDFLHELGEGTVRRVADRVLSPEVLTALWLRALVRQAEARYGRRPEAVVLAVPACFHANQRRALLDAAHWADLDVLALVSAATAGALDWHLATGSRAPGCVVVDFGQHKVDVSVLDIDPEEGLTVQATCGATGIGLAQMDRRVADFLADHFHGRTGLPLGGTPRQERELLERVRTAREQLGQVQATELVLRHRGQTVTVTLDRARYAALVAPVLRELQRLLWQVQSDVTLLTSDISHLLLLGGGAEVPAVRAALQQTTQHAPEPLAEWWQATPRGALAFARWGRREQELVDVVPYGLVLETPGGRLVTLLERNMPIPIRYTEALRPEAGDYRLWQQGAGDTQRQIPVGRFRFPDDLLAAAPDELTLLVDVNREGLPSLSWRAPVTGWEHPLTLEGFPWRQVASLEELLAGLELRD